MTSRSVVEIDVKDEKFRQFQAIFEKYRAGANAMPAAWAKIGKATEDAAKQGQKAFEDEAHAIAMMTVSLAQVVKHQNNIEKNARNSNSVLKETARITASIATNVANTTFQLLKWGALGGIAGIATGFFGASALANAGANLRSQSQRANVSPGQLHSARNNIGIYGIDTDSLFGNINAAQNSLVGQGTLAQLGISGADLQKSPGDLLPTLLPKMVQMLKQFGGTSEAFNALGFGNITDFQTLQQLGRLNPKEFSGMMSNYQNDISKLNIDDKTLMESQRLATSFHDAADAIENVFMKGIVKYAPQIEELSGKIVTGFGEIVTFLTSNGFLKFAGAAMHPIDTLTNNPLRNAPEVQQGTSGIPWLDRALGKNNSWLHPGSAGSAFTPNPMLNSIYGIESSYGKDPRAFNRSSTFKGPFQVGSAVMSKYGITDPFDYANASHGASLFLDDLTRKYHGDQHKIVAAYNQGETTIDALIKAHPKDWEKFAPKQAQDYIAKYDRLNAANRQTLNSYAGGNPSLSSGGVNINIFNNTGGNAIVTASQLAVPQ